jgi:hypothetical protein
MHFSLELRIQTQRVKLIEARFVASFSLPLSFLLTWVLPVNGSHSRLLLLPHSSTIELTISFEQYKSRCTYVHTYIYLF